MRYLVILMLLTLSSCNHRDAMFITGAVLGAMPVYQPMHHMPQPYPPMRPWGHP